MRPTALVLPFLFFWAQVTPAPIDPGVEKLVLPVLEALCASCTGGYNNEKVLRLGKRLADLQQNTSQAADQAVVILLDYQFTGAYAEDLVENIDSRGQSVVPYLRRYRAHPTWGLLKCRTCLEPLRATPEGRESHFLWLTERLDRPRLVIKWQAVASAALRCIVSEVGGEGQTPGQRLDVVSMQGDVLHFCDGQAVLGLTPLLIGPKNEMLLLVEWSAAPKGSVVQAMRYLPGPVTEPRYAEGQIVAVGELQSRGARPLLLDVDGDGYPEVVTFEPAGEGTPTTGCRSLMATANKWTGSGFVKIGQACQEDIVRLFRNDVEQHNETR
jgi:hypothetical protein